MQTESGSIYKADSKSRDRQVLRSYQQVSAAEDGAKRNEGDKKADGGSVDGRRVEGSETACQY